MAVEKVKYICISPAFLGEKKEREERLQKELLQLMEDLAQSFAENLGWLRLERTDQQQTQVFYYNQNVRGLFPDLSRPEYTSPLFRISSPVDISRIFASRRLQLAGLPTSLIRKEELRRAFPAKSGLKEAADRWHWSPGLLGQYFAVLPCGQGCEVCRVDGGPSTFWGADTQEKACLIILTHMANHGHGQTWQDDLLLLMLARFQPVLDGGARGVEFLDRYGACLKSKGGTLTLDWDLLEQMVNAADWTPGAIVKPTGQEQSARLRTDLLQCDNNRAGLPQYDESILSPMHGHWDLWKYVQYNDVPAEQLPPPPEGKIWVDVSEENIYARNAAGDLAPDAETVSVDFGTKSTTVARMDNEGNIVTLPVGAGYMEQEAGQDGGGEKGYENPTILKYIDLDSFREAYASAEGRPATKFSDLSASHTAEQQFEQLTKKDIGSIQAYQYHIKQWAFDNQFEPLIFDRHRQIKLKPYREIGEEDFDPIEAYAYLVGLAVVHMRRRICTRYVLSYPPSYGTDICEKMRRSFERGLRKAIPVQAQRTAAFQSNFSVLLRQSEPAAYAVCALKEFAIEEDRALCGVYDLGGGTVDYHFGVFTGGEPPFRYESRQNGGNPRLGCENILEALAYEVFSLVKEDLLRNRIPYEFPSQYAANLEDTRYTSHSQLARLNTLGMVNALRELWIRGFQPSDGDSDRLCRFEIYSETETDKPRYLNMIAVSAKEGEEDRAEWEESGGLPKILLDPEFLKSFFRSKLKTTVWEFLDMHRAVQQREGSGLPLLIFLAGNGSRSPMVKEIFSEYLPKFNIADYQIYPPLGTPEAKEKGQWVKDRPGSVPNAKTGVAHGLLMALPGSDFVRIIEEHRDFVFRYHVGAVRYDRKARERVFYRRKNADSFGLFQRYEAPSQESLDAPFPIGEDGYLQIWYTDATLTADPTPASACGARQFLIQVPFAFLSGESYEGIRGECYYQAVSETELELFIRPADEQNSCCPYGILNLDTGLFEAHPNHNEE